MSEIISENPKIEIYQGNSLEILKTLPDKSVNLVFTSPPYNCGNSGKNKDMYKHYEDNLSNEDYFQLLDKSLKECLRICNGLIFFNLNFMRNNQSVLLRWLSDNNNKLRDIMIWDKKIVQPPIGNILGKRVEFIFIFADSETTIINNFRENLAKKYTHLFGNWLSNLIQLNTKTDILDSKIHRAGFPIELPKTIIDIYSKEDDVVLDPFMGCGTTLIAAGDLKRNAIGIEISEIYYQEAKKIINGVLAQSKLF